MKNKRVMYIKDLFRNVKTGKVYEKSEIFPYKGDLKEFIEEAKRIKYYVNHIVWNDEDDFIYLCENILGLKPHEDINKKDIIHIKQVYCIANDGQEIHKIRDIPLPDREKYLQWVCREYRYNNKTTMMYEGYDINSYILSVNCENSNCYAVGNFNGISDKSTIYDLGDIVEFNYGLYDKLFGIITYTYNYSKYYHTNMHYSIFIIGNNPTEFAEIEYIHCDDIVRKIGRGIDTLKIIVNHPDYDIDDDFLNLINKLEG